MSIEVKLDAGKDNSASVYLLLDPTSGHRNKVIYLLLLACTKTAITIQLNFAP